MSSTRSKNDRTSGKIHDGIDIPSDIVQTSLLNLPSKERHSLSVTPEELVVRVKAISSAPDNQPEILCLDNVSWAHYFAFWKILDIDNRDQGYEIFMPIYCFLRG